MYSKLNGKNSLLLHFNIREVVIHEDMNPDIYYKFCYEYITLWFGFFNRFIINSKEDVSIHFVKNKKIQSFYDSDENIIYLDINHTDLFLLEYAKFVFYKNKHLNIGESTQFKNIYSRYLKDCSKSGYFEDSIEMIDFFSSAFEYCSVISNIKNNIDVFCSCRYLKVQDDFHKNQEQIGNPYLKNYKKISKYLEYYL